MFACKEARPLLGLDTKLLKNVKRTTFKRKLIRNRQACPRCARTQMTCTSGTEILKRVAAQAHSSAQNL